jgi:hypothetical protein
LNVRIYYTVPPNQVQAQQLHPTAFLYAGKMREVLLAEKSSQNLYEKNKIWCKILKKENIQGGFVMLRKVDPTQTMSWRKLRDHFDKVKNLHMRDLFAEDAKRFDLFSSVHDLSSIIPE